MYSSACTEVKKMFQYKTSKLYTFITQLNMVTRRRKNNGVRIVSDCLFLAVITENAHW